MYYLKVRICTKELEVFFGFDYAVIVPIGLALWAFTTSLCILMLGKKDEYYMGITFSELFHLLLTLSLFLYNDLNPLESDNYNVRVDFVETGKNQDSNTARTFAGHIF